MTAQHRWILCGGLASGKSLVRVLLAEAAGLFTIDADGVGHDVIEPAGAAFAEVVSTWPEVVQGGRIDRKALAAIVFSDRDQLARLESLTHPHIGATIEEEITGVEGVVVVEMPLLGDMMGEGWRRMVVDSHDETRLRRAVARGMDEADARARMASQPTRAEWLAAADLVIPNHADADELRSTVAAVVVALSV